MSSIDEIGKASTQLASALADGLIQLDLRQVIKLQGYTRVVLPIDGFVFWQPTVPLCIKGSLHYSQQIQQDETETLGAMTVVLSTDKQIVEFEAMPPNTIWVGDIDGALYAFSQQQGFYTQASLWHYLGHVISPAMRSQLLTAENIPDESQAVVSNSLPFWLQMNNYAPPLPGLFSNTELTLYPSFLSEPNIEPPYAAVHIGPEDTRVLQMAPRLDANRSHTQLCADRVRVTMYGLQNNAALDFMDFVLQYSLWAQNFGIMVSPTMRDGKRVQTELQALGMQKIMDLEISYNQSRVNTIARQLIEKATVAVLLNPNIVPNIIVTDSEAQTVIDNESDPVTSNVVF